MFDVMRNKQVARLCAGASANAETVDEMHRSLCNMATYMESCGRVMMAAAQTGLSQAVRTAVMHEHKVLLRRMLGNLIHSKNGMPQLLFGMSTHLLLSMLFSIEARIEVLNCIPRHLRKRFAELVLGSDHLERHFSVIVQVCGFKPSFVVMLGLLTAISYLRDRKSMPDSERVVNIPASRKHRYNMAPRVSDDSVGDWNNGAAVKPFLEGVMREKTVKELPRVTRDTHSVRRKFHNHRPCVATTHIQQPVTA